MFEKVTKHFKVAALRRRIRKLRIDEAAQIAVVNAQVDVINKAKLAGVNVAWTSYRSADEEAFVEAQGGTVVKYSAKMNVLLYKPGSRSLRPTHHSNDEPRPVPVPCRCP
jgi:hypothetical protein